jgi:hypothetical protein
MTAKDSPSVQPMLMAPVSASTPTKPRASSAPDSTRPPTRRGDLLHFDAARQPALGPNPASYPAAEPNPVCGPDPGTASLTSPGAAGESGGAVALGTGRCHHAGG